MQKNYWIEMSYTLLMKSQPTKKLIFILKDKFLIIYFKIPKIKFNT